MMSFPCTYRNSETTLRSSYPDYSKADVNVITAKLGIPKFNRKGPRGGVVLPFPVKMYAMLQGAKKDNLESIVSWSFHGRCFMVHDPERFAKEILPIYFKQTKLSSFHRQLNLWGFNKVTSGADKGAHYHAMFLRGRMDLAKVMYRVKRKGNDNLTDKTRRQDPNFSSMPICSEDMMETSLLDNSCHSVEEDEDDLFHAACSVGPLEYDNEGPATTNVAVPEVSETVSSDLSEAFSIALVSDGSTTGSVDSTPESLYGANQSLEPLSVFETSKPVCAMGGGPTPLNCVSSSVATAPVPNRIESYSPVVMQSSQALQPFQSSPNGLMFAPQAIESGGQVYKPVQAFVTHRPLQTIITNTSGGPTIISESCHPTNFQTFGMDPQPMTGHTVNSLRVDPNPILLSPPTFFS